jgi:hypothetical protein
VGNCGSSGSLSLFPLSSQFIPADYNAILAKASTRDETVSWILTEVNWDSGNDIKPEDKE